MIVTKKNIFASLLLLCLGAALSYAQEQSKPESLFTKQFVSASALSVDPLGVIYIADAGTHEIYKFTPDGKLAQKTGGYGWSEGSFDRPTDIITPNGLDVYVADYGNHRIQRFDKNLNIVSTINFREDDEPNHRFGYPAGIAVDRFGDLYIIDGENIRILKIKGNTVERTFGGVDAGAGRLRKPATITINNQDRVFVLDNGEMVVYDIFGNFITRLYKNITAMALIDNDLAVLDSCHLKMAFSSARERLMIQYLAHDDEKNACSCIDIEFQKEKFYGLTKNRVIKGAFVMREEK